MTYVFTGVTLHKAERDLKRGLLHFSANLTKPIAEAMKWGDLPKASTSSSMEGSIIGVSLSMSAKQAGLFEKGEFRSQAQSLDKFEIVRLELKGKKGKGFRHVVRFVARFVDSDILALAEQWIISVGDGTATLTATGELSQGQTQEEEK
jgi:hypothetical protein